MVIWRPIVWLSILTISCKVAGLGEKIAVAHYFGTDEGADSFFAATAILWSVVFFLRDIINPVLIPVYLQLRNKFDRNRADQMIVGVLMVLALSGLGLALFFYLQAEVVTGVLLRGFDGERLEQTAMLIRSLTPAVIFLFVVVVTQSVLNARGRFSWAAGGELFFKLSVIVFLVLSQNVLVRMFASSSDGSAKLLCGAGWAISLGALGKLVWHWCMLRREVNLRERPGWVAVKSDLGRMTLLLAPLVLGALFTHAGGLSENVFASYLPAGHLAGLNYAKRINEAIELIGPAALVTVVFTRLSTLVGRCDMAAATELMRRCIRVMIFAGTAVTVWLGCLREPLIAIILQRGRFDENSVQITSWALAGFAVGVIFFGLDALLVHAFFAFEDTLRPTTVGISRVLLDAGLCFLLFRSLGVCGIALSLSISKAIKVVVLGIMLRKKLPHIWVGDWGRFAAKVMACGLTMALIVNLFGHANVFFEGEFFSKHLTRVLFGSVAGFAVFLGMAQLLGLTEGRWCWQRIGRCVRGFPNGSCHEQKE